MSKYLPEFGTNIGAEPVLPDEAPETYGEYKKLKKRLLWYVETELNMQNGKFYMRTLHLWYKIRGNLQPKRSDKNNHKILRSLT